MWITFGGIFDIDKKISLVAELEALSAQENFWNDSNNAQKVLKEIKDAKRIIEPWQKAAAEIEEIQQFLIWQNLRTIMILFELNLTEILEKEILILNFTKSAVRTIMRPRF